MSLPSLRALPVRLRLASGYALFLVAVISAVGLYLLTALEMNLQREVDETLGLRAAHVERELGASPGEQLDPGGAAAALQDLAPLEEFAAPGVYVEVLNPSGDVLATSPNLPGGRLPATSELVAGALEGQETYATVPVSRERVRVLARPISSGSSVVGAVLVGESLHLVDATLLRLRQLLLVAAACAAVISLFAGWWLTGRALGPIAEISRVARQIASTGTFEQRITIPPAQDEVGELASTFNEMLARLESIFRRQREFLADASHELRGPLMVIRGNLDLLKLSLPPQDRLDSAREATEEVERMARLVADLLFLSEADAQDTVRHQQVALHSLVSEVLERARELDAGAHEVRFAQNDPVVVEGDHDRLVQLLWNLVENALRYTPAGGQVTLGLRREGQVVELVVSDTGIGIAPEHLPRIFERFYRVDKTRSRHQGGTGLGLAIVKQVTEAHRGQVRVRSEPGEGTTFVVVLPV